MSLHLSDAGSLHSMALLPACLPSWQTAALAAAAEAGYCWRHCCYWQSSSLLLSSIPAAGKLADCASTSRDECEIFLVEGDSAGKVWACVIRTVYGGSYLFCFCTVARLG